jgi:hypothetical protein
MFPMLAMLFLHGTLALVQSPILPQVLGVPTAFILWERLLRLCRGFGGIDATLEVNDEETSVITFEDPKGRDWNFTAGEDGFRASPMFG